MGKLTKVGRVQRGIDFKRRRNSIWLGIGRTTVWPDETEPPVEDVTATTVEELFGMKRFTESCLVTQDDNGSILFQGQYYKKLSDSEAIELQATDLYVRFDLQPDEFPGIDYRQIGVFVDSQPKSGFQSFLALSPSNFDKLGQLVYLSNEVKRSRYTNTRHLVELIIPG